MRGTSPPHVLPLERPRGGYYPPHELPLAGGHEGDFVPLMYSPSPLHGKGGCGRDRPQVVESSGGACPPEDGNWIWIRAAARMRGLRPLPPFFSGALPPGPLWGAPFFISPTLRLTGSHEAEGGN